MTESQFEHLLCAGVLLGRVGDVVSTYLATPKLKLEANPLVRRLRWPFALATLLVCLIPYWHTGVGVMALVVSWMVTARNLSHGWMARALGEERMLEMQSEAMRKASLATILAFILVAAAIYVGIGAATMVMAGTNNWGCWFGAGIGAYGVALGFHLSIHVMRMHRSVNRAGAH